MGNITPEQPFGPNTTERLTNQLKRGDIDAFNEQMEQYPHLFLTLDDQDLSGLDLTGANLRNARLRRAKCVGTKFIRANLTDSILRGADMTNADFTGASLYAANVYDTVIDGTVFEGANLRLLALDVEFHDTGPAHKALAALRDR